MTPEENTIGYLIYYHRRRCKLTQEELAQRLGISVPTLIGYEKGIRIPDAAFISKCAKEFKTSADDLLVEFPGQVTAGYLFAKSDNVGLTQDELIRQEYLAYKRDETTW